MLDMISKKFSVHREIDGKSWPIVVTLIALNSREKNIQVDGAVLDGAGLYLIENDGYSVVVEDLAFYFPEIEMYDKEEREEAFEDYAELLVMAGDCTPIPSMLC